MSQADNSGQFAGIALAVLAAMFLAFLGGMVAAIFQVFPFQSIQIAITQLTSEADAGELHFLNPARYVDSGVTVYKEDAVQPGVTLVTSVWGGGSDWQPAIRLLSFTGEVLHEWQVHPDSIWPESPHTDRVSGQFNTPANYVHGSKLLPGGEIVFNIEYLGMVKLNACGDVEWKVPHRLHHSVSQDDEGNFWASGLYWREEAIDEYVHLWPPFVEETMVQVSPQGEVLREISIIDAMYSSGFEGSMALSSRTRDFSHMNDVEVLSADIADKFPMFNAGDIMVSLRNLNMVLVVDGETERVKWHFRHPLIRQHDPDFEADGHIVIFDNNDDTTTDGSRWGSTQLLRVDPATNAYQTVYPLDDDQSFYTREGGKHQLLENGNRLITEAMVGRVFEVTPAGETVWNWVIEDGQDELVPEVLEGTRYPYAMTDFIATLDCS